jgi:hypothetical protein
VRFAGTFTVTFRGLRFVALFLVATDFFFPAALRDWGRDRVEFLFGLALEARLLADALRDVFTTRPETVFLETLFLRPVFALRAYDPAFLLGTTRPLTCLVEEFFRALGDFPLSTILP